MPLVLTAPAEYPYILAGLSLNFFLLSVSNIAIGVRNRKAVFTKLFMEQFQEEHEKVYPGK